MKADHVIFHAGTRDISQYGTTGIVDNLLQ